MSWLLNILYVCFLVIVSPWLLWRYITAGKNRRGWAQKIFGAIPKRNSDRQCVWMHAVSVGEVNLLSPVLKQLLLDKPELEVVISTTTETGFDLAVEKYPNHQVFFCPMDFTWAIKRVLTRIRPSLLILAELEIWPNLIATLTKHDVPVAVVNGRLSENSLRGYLRFKWLLNRTFQNLTLIAVQNQTYADRFCELGCALDRVVVTGSVKFDGVETNRKNQQTLALGKLAGIDSNDFVFVAGSTQAEEDLIAARVYQQLKNQIPNLRLVLVPRHPERCGALIGQLDELKISYVRRSQLKDDFSDQPNSILIVDVIGELSAWWGLANVAYVGGSMGRREGQNMIEPSAFGLPVSFGPRTANFQQLVDELLAHDAATVVYDETTLRELIERVFSDNAWAESIGERAKKVVMNHVGASQRTVDSLSPLLATCSDELDSLSANSQGSKAA